MKFLMHVDDEPAIIEIDGRLFSIPPHEIFEVPEIRGNDFNNNGSKEYILPDHYVLAKILEHAWYHGIVEVPVIKTKTGVQADVETARKLAGDALQMAQDKILTRYVTDQQERVTQHNKPAMAPGGRVAKIIERRGIDLKKEFNIDPPGYTVTKLSDRDAEIQSLKEQNAQMQEQMKLLLDAIGANSGKTKGR